MYILLTDDRTIYAIIYNHYRRVILKYIDFFEKFYLLNGLGLGQWRVLITIHVVYEIRE